MRGKDDHVRELLPEYAERGPRPAGDVERHLASCRECSTELDAFRALLSSLEDLRALEIDPEPEFLETTLETLRRETGPGRVLSLAEFRAARQRLAQAVRSPRAGYAVASITGAAVGATAIALLWWRLARKAVSHGAL